MAEATPLPEGRLGHVANARHDPAAPWPAGLDDVASLARAAIECLPGCAPTPLRLLDGLADAAGNHGRSVAWSRRLFGRAGVIYRHRDVSAGRAAALAALGADSVRGDGNYDDSMQAAARDPALAAVPGLDRGSGVPEIGTEGAPDPGVYRQLVDG